MRVLAESEVFMSADKKISELFSVFLELRSLSEGTEEIYLAALKYLVKFLSDRPADAYSPMDAQIFQKRLSDGRSATTVNMYVRAIKAFFNWCVDVEIVSVNPFRRVKSLREKPAVQRVYEDVEITKLLRYAKSDRWRLIIALAATTALRRGEILNLTVGEIDYADGVITLRDKLKTKATWLWSIKDYESRQVPITGYVESLLLRVHAALPEGQPYICLTAKRYRQLMAKDEILYRWRKCPEVNFRRTFVATCARSGVEYRKFHTLRGAALTCMAENGLQPHELQAIAGHASVRTTYHYYVRPRKEVLNKARSAAFNNNQQWAV